MKTSRLLLLGWMFTVQILHGQSLSGLVQKAELLFEETQKNLVFPKTEGFLPYQHFYTQLDSTKNKNLWQTQLKELESSQYRKDIGLVFKANAQYNFRSGFDEETNNFNIGRIRAELEWNILKSGYTNNRTKALQLANEQSILVMKKTQQERELMRRQFRIDYTYSINQETMELFEKFLAFENEYFDYLNQLYFKKYIKREALIKTGHQINILKNQLSVLQKENMVLKDSVSLVYQENQKLPFLQFNIDSLSLQPNQESLELQKRNVELEHKAMNDLNLSLYVQENMNYLKNGHRLFPSVGIRFRAPIRFNHRKKIIETKKKIIVAQEIDKSVGKYNRLITQVNSYNEKLKDVQNQHKNWEAVQERIRILSVLKSELDHHETGTLILSLMEEQFKILENMMQLKRQLYTTLAHIFELTEVSALYRFIEPIRFEEFSLLKTFGIKKSMSYSTSFQIEFLKAKGCTEVEVLEQEIELQKALHKAGISFKKVTEINQQLVEKAIQSELFQIQSKS